MHVHAPEEKAELRGFGQPDEVREFRRAASSSSASAAR